MNRLKIISLVGFLLFCLACEEQVPEQTIPFAIINEDLNLDHVQNVDLKNPGGFVYHSAGYKGLIIYHASDGNFRVFERACTHDPRSDCPGIVVDDSRLFMIHECCKSTFNFEGDVTSGPAQRRLLEYQSIVDGIYLKIRNG